MPTFTLIQPAVVVGSGGSASIDFSSIPATYTDLVLKLSTRTNRSAASDWVKIEFNTSTANFSFRNLEAANGTVGSFSGTSNFSVYTTGNTATSSTFGNGEIYISNYAFSNNKSVSNDGVTENNSTDATLTFNALLWSNSAAINQITLKPNTGTLFLQHSTAYLYGVSNA